MRHLLKYGSVDRYADKAYKRLQDQIITEFGIGEDLKKVMQLKIKIASLETKVALTGERIHIIFINKLKEKLQEIQEREVDADPYKTLYYINKHLGYHLDINTVSVLQFYKFSEYIKEQNK